MARVNAAVPSVEITDWGGPIRESLLQILDEGDKANGAALGEEITEGAQSNLKEISTKGKEISGSTILRGPILEGMPSIPNHAISLNSEKEGRATREMGKRRLLTSFKPQRIEVLPSQSSNQKGSDSGLAFGVYALNSLEGRMELWRELTDIATGVVEPWAVMGDFNTLKNVKSELKCWNKESIRDVFKNVKDAELDLGRIQHHLSLDPLDDSLAVLEKEAKGKLWAALQMEERFLKEKSRVNGEEIRRVVLSLKDSKAPGPDGFGAGFYKHSWEVIGEELTNAVQWFIANSFMPHSINATFITLVPKYGDVSTFAGFWPIALCNLLYKIITKIPSNRIQHVIGSVVSHNQSAFIKGRSIVDNILVCHDIVRGIEQKATSPTAVLKVDLHKAYDSLSRKFLFDVMGRMGFSDKFIGWVKACVTTPMFSVLINGSPAGFFGGGRGIRQGDPLSPYLFTLAMEAFSGIMRRLEIDGQIKLLPRCKSFHLSHIIFTDDLMIFVKGNRDSISASLGRLDEFAALSGLQLNRSKSSIILGGLTQASSLELLDLTGFSETKLPIRYLGVPLVSGRLSMKDCSPILDLVRRKLEGWKARFLSYAGHLQLLSSVLQGSYIYWAGIFGLPGNVVTKLESMFSNFLWSGPSLERKTHFISWDAVCKPKSEGGLGIKRVKEMNIAGITKQIWWISSKKDRLWVNWVQQRYLKQESLWTVKGLNNCSWVWRKVLKYKDKALPFIKTIIGDGSTTKLWLDNWHPFGVLVSRFGNRICYDAGSYSLAARHACVKEIIRDGDWHPGPSTSFDLIDIWRALPAIDKFHDEVSDLTVWTGNSSAWRCLSDALPTRDNLIHRHIPTPHHCVFCWAGTESRNHLFFGCPFTTDIWKHIYDLCFHDGATPSNAIDAAISVRYVAGRAGKLGLVIKLAFCATIKHIWSERNYRIFRNKIRSKDQIVGAIKGDVIGRLSSIDLVGDPTTADHHIAAKWDLQAGFGGLIRDDSGDPLAAFAGIGEDLSVLSMELMTIYRGISLCVDKGFYDVSIRSDSKLAVDILNGVITGPWQILTLKSKIQIKARLLRSKEFIHVWREQNQPADFMASIPTDPSGIGSLSPSLRS
ncbi:uncharacterized protein LOC122647354 [Telopea speciosissima]|uniref:uncharacterized protein LOC122647354 n=1 Tax=Telopea speciosissima TaxID=54955 RepID=UPI001CC5614C|nr:uncharacterized protein LOC122647354 [Telopea speciosissima]